MEKIYIATSSLNFNNILATESISPEAFYKNRTFGYKRFNKVSPNPFSNCLIAYDKIPLYTIDDTDYDDYPLVIELSKDLINENLESNSFEGNGGKVKVFQISKTIYLHPNKVKLLFFSENHKKTCLIKVEPSIETKLLPFYKPTIQVIKQIISDNAFKWDETIFLNIKDLSEKEISIQTELDSKLNKIKGFYYSYFLGIILSSSIKQLSFKEEFIHIANIIVDFVKNEEKNQYENKSIDYINDFKNKVSKSIGNKSVPMEELVNALYIDESGITEHAKLIAFLKQTKPEQFDFYSQLGWSVEQKNENNHILLLLDDLIAFIKTNNSISILSKKTNRISKYISTLKQEKIKQVNPLFVIENIHFNGYKITHLADDFFKDKGADLYRNLINDILGYPINSVQEFKEEKVNLTYKIGSILKEYIPNWEKSKERIYFNSLMDNIESYKRFDLKSHPNVILQSIALFIQKGEDPEKLIESLTQNQISDYRIALGLWGSIFGFSALPKTITNRLFTKSNSELAISFYEDVQRKLHNSISDSSLKIESIIQIAQPIIEEKKEKGKNPKEIKSPSHSKEKPETLKMTDKLQKCPKCGADMVLRGGKYGNFYGCSQYAKTKCDGKIKIKETTQTKLSSNDPLQIILEYINSNGHSKIADIIPVIKERINIKYNVADIESIIKEFLNDQLELSKLGKSKGVKFKDEEFFK